MELSWISPLYLSGVLLLSLPVLIHLVQKQSRSAFKFPSLMFLRKIPYQEKRRLQIRNWWLLILRCLLLLLIVLAFSRPFFLSGDKTLLVPERGDSVILIDKSYSMRISGQWRQAREIALNQLDRLNPPDRAAIVVFDNRVEVLSEFSSDFDRLGELVTRQQPGFRTTRLRGAIEQAARMLAVSDASRKRILLISDFQASAAGEDGVPGIAADIELNTFAVSRGDVPNASISAFSLAPSSAGDGNHYTLDVTLTNHSSEAVDRQIKLNLNGGEVYRRDLRLEPNSVIEHRIDRLKLGEDPVRGVISLDDDALPIDNYAYFVHSVSRAAPVLILEGSRPRSNQSFYLENALGISRDPLFRVKKLSLDQFDMDDLANQAVIIVNDAPIPGGEFGAALFNFVKAGGGLILATGNGVQGNWPSGDEGFLPGTLLSRVDSKAGSAFKISALDANHPLSAMLDDQHGRALGQARIFSYRNLRANAGDRVIGRYDDGAVALLERRVGKGRVLVLTTTLDPEWNDLALQPIFLPFLHQSLRYLADFESSPATYEPGSVVDVGRYARAFAASGATFTADLDAELIIELPSSEEIRLNRQSPLLNIEQPGFYQVHRATAAADEVVLAANVNPLESDLSALDLQRFEEDIRSSAQSTAPRIALTPVQLEGREQQQRIWRLILFAVMGLICIEALTANWISRRDLSGRQVNRRRQ